MGKSPLAPVTITDRNGVVTTRNKKIATVASPSRTMPVPQIPSELTNDEITDLLSRFKTREGTGSTLKLTSAIRALSRENYEKMNEMLAAPVRKREHHNARNWMASEILTKPAAVGSKRKDIGWKLDVILALTHGSDMHIMNMQLFANTISNDERYTELMEDLPEANEQARQQVCDIATALTRIDNEYSDRITNRTPINERKRFFRDTATVAGKKVIVFDDQTVVDALLEHPDKAEMITDLYLERGSVDALDSVLSVASTLAEGAL
jgi:hypothetical protein